MPAAEYEARFHKYFVINDAMLQRIRTWIIIVVVIAAGVTVFVIIRKKK